MKYRAAKRHARRGRPTGLAALAPMFAALKEVARELCEAFTRAVNSIDWGALTNARTPARELEPAPGNPEDAVIDAINGLERDEIGDTVRWQLEQGMARGDHIGGFAT